jgi:hypothetical protein
VSAAERSCVAARDEAAVALGVLQMDWEQDDEEYYLYVPKGDDA